MKSTTAYAIAWISCSVSISVAIYTTKSIAPLWAFLLPALLSVESK